ncbi:arginine--tRNA ligase [Candidatus Nomurabacteria bacterium CG1_02_43_90]|uniref:Arginine--tRNA ligase n=1 Tax=Candidatus Nomurabacteria bacterium CG1_02_43_90 TaxID=1805281 RepID=A0A1J4V6K2_9BACT|nr:MAG: arginine--tRNA ligase [Candidatus Nomurabacteria bacterium CG1_02_43_90]
MKEKLEIIVREALRALSIEVNGVVIERPADITHGDYSTNVALACAKEAGLSPRELAEKMVEKIREQEIEEIKDITIAGPGFINFKLSDDAIRNENAKEKSSLITCYAGKNILVEHSSPNLFKPFSIGHLMNNFIGEFIVRGAKISGGKVKSMSFPSDVSLGIAKALFILEKDMKAGEIDLTYFQNNKENDVIKYLGDAYVRGVKECEKNEESLQGAKKVLDKMYHLVDDTFYDLVVATKKVNESYFKKILSEIGSEIDAFVYEGWAGDEGKKIVQENTGEGKVFKESEGAIVYTPSEERKDINTAVFVNSQGYPTYEAKDLGLLKIKFERLATVGIKNFFPDMSFSITDVEQVPHFKVVFDAANKLGDEWIDYVKKSTHVPHGRMLFKGQKMSSRLGGIPLALDVIGVVEEEVRERAGEKIAHLSAEEKKKLEREIALSALRIAVLRSKPGMSINFDPEMSLSFEGDSGPYLLYTHARCASLLEKGKEKGYEPVFKNIPATNLERELAYFEVLLTDAIENIAPQKLVTYLFEVTQLFNGFYANTQIITDDKEKTEHHLAITRRAKTVLKEGLWVLGISSPERM